MGQDVRHAGDTTSTAAPQVLQQTSFCATEYRKARKTLSHFVETGQIVRIAGAVLHTRSLSRERFGQPGQQGRAERDPAHLRDVIEVHPQPLVGYTLENGSKGAEDALIRYVRIVKRRHCQDTMAAGLERMAGQGSSFRIGWGTAADEQFFGWDAGLNYSVKRMHALGRGKRGGFAVGAKKNQSMAAPIQQMGAELAKGRAINSEVRINGRQNRGIYAA